MADAKFVNKEQILARLRRLPAGVEEAARAELKTQVDDLAGAIRRATPVGKTGNLLKSIEVRPGRRPLSYIVSAGGPLTTVKVRKGVSDHDFLRALQSGGNRGEFDYSRGVEFGHTSHEGVHVPAQPFFFPTYRAWVKGMKNAIRKAVRERLKRDFPSGGSNV